MFPMDQTALICVDWGTSSFRLWAMARSGLVLAERRGKYGMSTLKPDAYEPLLETTLSDISVPDDVPVIICGMAGAAQGWMEVAYVDTPADLTHIPLHAIRIPGIKRDVRILPGIAQRDTRHPNVMRGEETLLLGAHSKGRIEGMVCLPGTHSKWAHMNGNTVSEFATAMTGEIFALLSEHSTLSHFLGEFSGAGAHSTDFSDAVRESLEAPESILGTLFTVRAGPILFGVKSAVDMQARLSGLLIGLEIAGISHLAGDHAVLISSGPITENYLRAFELASIKADLMHAEEVVRTGLFHAGQILWPERLN